MELSKVKLSNLTLLNEKSTLQTDCQKLTETLDLIKIKMSKDGASYSQLQLESDFKLIDYQRMKDGENELNLKVKTLEDELNKKVEELN